MTLDNDLLSIRVSLLTNIEIFQGLGKAGAIPNSASSPIWDARTCWRRILRVSLSFWAAARKPNQARSCPRAIEATLAACWGPMLVARSLWREFGLESILDGLAPKTKTVQKAARLPLADRVLVLVANRLCRPGSEHALAQWLESDFVCGRDGKRILARWKQQGRVRVELELAPRVVSHAGPVVGAQRPYRSGTLWPVARSVPPGGRDGLLRPDEHLF